MAGEMFYCETCELVYLFNFCPVHETELERVSDELANDMGVIDYLARQ